MVGSPASPDMWSLAWLDQIAPLIQAAAVLVTSSVAVCSLTAWRRQIIGKRKTELAEQVLFNFYAARDALIEARSPGFLSSEGKTRKLAETESDQVQLMRNTYFIPIERLTREKVLFANLHVQWYVFSFYFGASRTTPFEAMLNAHNSIIRTANRLIDISQYDGASQQVADCRDSLLSELGWGKRERPDETDRAIDVAVSEIEALCTPILRGRNSWVHRLIRSVFPAKLYTMR
jgi:hypothetical protein